jgi:hypothetical protein
MPTIKAEDGGQNGSQQATPNPRLETRGLVEEDGFGPISLPSVGHDHDVDDTNDHVLIDMSCSFNLSRLLFVPPAPEQGTKEPTVHTIVGVFTIIPPSVPSMMMDTTGSGNTQQQWGQASSVIARWEVQFGLGDKLSPCFDQLSVKKKGTGGVVTTVSYQLKSDISATNLDN